MKKVLLVSVGFVFALVLNANTSADYQLKIEYAALAESEVLIYVDGQALAFFSLPKTGVAMSAMETCLLDVPVSQGTHTVSFEMSRGTINLNKFSLL